MDPTDKYELLINFTFLTSSIILSACLPFILPEGRSENTIILVTFLVLIILIWLIIKCIALKFDKPDIEANRKTVVNIKDKIVRLFILGLVGVSFGVFVICISMNQSTYPIAFTGIIPMTYILALIRRTASKGKCQGYFYIFSFCLMLIIYGAYILMCLQNETDFIIVLSVVGFLLQTSYVFLNFIIIKDYLSCYCVSTISCLLIFLMGLAYEIGDKEAKTLSILIAVIIPFYMSLSCVWAHFDMNYYKKTSAFLVLWALLDNIAMRVSSQFFDEDFIVCRNFLTYFAVFVGIYTILSDFVFRIGKIKKRENINAIVLSFFIMPMGVSISVFIAGCINVYAVLAIILCSIYFGAITFLCLYKSDFIPKLPNYELLVSRVLFEMFLSLLWKVSFIVGYTFINSKLYFFSESQHEKSVYLAFNLLLFSTLISSCLLESINFFIKEKGHIYPSLRRISTVENELISLRQDDQYMKKKIFKYLLSIFIIIQILLCLIFLLDSYSLVISSSIVLILEMLFSLLGIELKNKVWNHGEKVIAYYNVFLWICIYSPYLSFIIPKSLLDNHEQDVIWTCAIAAILSFSVFSSVILSKFYYEATDINMWQMIKAAIDKKCDKNTSKLIAEMNIYNHDLLPSEISKDFTLPRNTLCSGCQLVDHETIQDENMNQDLAALNFLLLKDEDNNIVTAEIINNNDDSESPSAQFIVKSSSIRDLFSVNGDDYIYRINFVNEIKKKFRKLKRHMLITMFIQISGARKLQLKQKFDDKFLKKMLSLLAIKIYKADTIKEHKKVLDRLLGNPPKKIIQRSLSESVIKLTIKAEDFTDNFIPYAFLSLPNNFSGRGLKEILVDLKNSRDRVTDQIIEKCFSLTNAILFGNFFQFYALSSLALTNEMNWLNSKLSLTAFPFLARFSWILSLCLNFVFCPLLILTSILIMCLLKRGINNKAIKKFCYGLFVFLTSGFFVETIIGLFSVMNCEYTEGIGYHVFGNDNMICFSTYHIGLFIGAIAIFIFYYLFVLLFYPFMFKEHSSYEGHFNIDINGQLLYCIIFVFIPQSYLNIKLFMSLFLSAFICLFWVQNALEREERYINMKVMEYFIITLIYFCSCIFYNFNINFVGFWILLAIICADLAINIIASCRNVFSKMQSQQRRVHTETACPLGNENDSSADITRHII